MSGAQDPPPPGGNDPLPPAKQDDNSSIFSNLYKMPSRLLKMSLAGEDLDPLTKRPDDPMNIDDPDDDQQAGAVSDRAPTRASNPEGGQLSPYNSSGMNDPPGAGYLSPYNSSGMNDPPKSPASSKNDKSTTSASAGSPMDISEVEDRVADVKTYFTNSGMQFRKMIADGNHGGTMLFDKPIGNGEVKSLVVKYALETDEDRMSNNDEDLSNEMYWLQKLQFAEHIIQIDPQYSFLWDDGQTGPGQLLRRPVIVMEYMQHGTLSTMKKRFRHTCLRVPDRMAWYFMLCLVRACVAMAYRDQFAIGQTKREKIPRAAEGETGPRPPSTLSQHSLKGLNVLIGELTPGDSEHGLLPLLKLIDFGRGEEINPNEDSDYGDQSGVSSNLDGVGYIISDLLHDARVYQNKRSKWDIRDNDVFLDQTISTDADRKVLEDELIDRRLRDTIAYFRAGNAKQLPPLQDALALCRHGIKNINKSTNPIDSDASMNHLVQNLIFDADFDYLTFDYEFEDTAFTEAQNRAIEAEKERRREWEEMWTIA